MGIFSRKDWRSRHEPGPRTPLSGEALDDLEGRIEAAVEDVLARVLKPSTFNLTLDGHMLIRGSADAWARGLLSAGTTGDSIVKRTSTGAVHVGPPTINAHAARLVDLNARLSAAQREAIDALNPGTATVADVVNALKAS